MRLYKELTQGHFNTTLAQPKREVYGLKWLADTSGAALVPLFVVVVTKRGTYTHDESRREEQPSRNGTKPPREMRETDTAVIFESGRGKKQ